MLQVIGGVGIPGATEKQLTLFARRAQAGAAKQVKGALFGPELSLRQVTT